MVSLKAAAGLEDGLPLDVVDGAADLFAVGRRMWYLRSMMREAASARSRNLPTWRKFQPSTWVRVASVVPLNWWEWSTIWR